MSLTIDAREGGLIDVLSRYAIPHAVSTLPVGDILCEYEDKTAWIAERKRADDLANSIKNGRWHEQQSRLFDTGIPVVFILEGDFRNTAIGYQSMIGASVNAELRKHAHVFRTWDINETAYLLSHLVSKIPALHLKPSGIQLTSKRKRDADVETCWLRQLMCIPSISERIARALLTEFGSLPKLQKALADLETFPLIKLDERTSIGKVRRQKLAYYLVGSD